MKTHRLPVVLTVLAFWAPMLALAATPVNRVIGLKGWRPLNVADMFDVDVSAMGLSTERSFSVVTRVTLPPEPELAKWGACLSLGERDKSQLTLTFSKDQGAAYLSAGGAPSVLSNVWYVPAGTFSVSRDGGRTYSIAMVNDVETGEVALYLDGAKQGLSTTKNGAAGKMAFTTPATFPLLRLGNRAYGVNTATQHFKDAVYTEVGVFGFALTAAQTAQLHNGGTGLALKDFIATLEGSVTLDLATNPAWSPAYDGGIVILKGSGTLTLSAAAAPALLILEDGAALTVSTPMGVGVTVRDQLMVGTGATVSAVFTALPETSGSYTVLTSPGEAFTPALATVTLPGGGYDSPEGSGLNDGSVEIALAATEGAALRQLTFEAGAFQPATGSVVEAGAAGTFGVKAWTADVRGLSVSGLPFTSATDFSVACWVHLPASGDYPPVFSLGESGKRQVTLTFFGGASGARRAYLSSSAAASGGTNALVGEWGNRVKTDTAHPGFEWNTLCAVVLTYDASENLFSLYLNGEKQTLTVGTGTANADKATALGHPGFHLTSTVAFPELCLAKRAYGNASSFAGAVYDDVGIFDVALSAAQVATLYNEGSGRALSDFVAGLASTVQIDLSANPAWQTVWDGKNVALSGTGTLALSADAAPQSLTLADGTALTLLVPAGSAAMKVVDAFSAGAGATVSVALANVTVGEYTVLSCAGTAPTFDAVSGEDGTLAYSALSNGVAGVLPAGLSTDVDGAYLLASATDYDLYLATAFPVGTVVKLTEDLALEAKTYTARASFNGTFDGQGHTLTLPEGGSVVGVRSVGLIAGGIEEGSIVRNLRVEIAGTLSGSVSAGGLIGGCGSYNSGLTVENCWVSLSGGIRAGTSGTCGAGLICGEVWGTKKGGVKVSDLRVELLPTATVKGGPGRGAGGVVGSASEALALSDVLVVIGEGASVSGGVSGNGGVLGHKRDTYTATGVTVVDFGGTLGSPAKGYLDGGAPVVVWQAPPATLAVPSASSKRTFCAGLFPVRDNGNPMLMTGASEECLVGEPSLVQGSTWNLVDAADRNCVYLSPADPSDLDESTEMTYVFRAATVPEGRLFDGNVEVVCQPTMLNAEGFAELRSGTDYAWYLSEKCASNAKVQMTADIELTGTYEPKGGFWGTFDGNEKTLTLTTSAKVQSSVSEWSYAGMIASVLDSGALVKDLTIDVRGAITAMPDASKSSEAGAVCGATKWLASNINVQNVRVRLARNAGIFGANDVRGFGRGSFTGSNNVLIDQGVAFSGTTNGYVAASGHAACYKSSTVTTTYGSTAGVFMEGEQRWESGTLTLVTGAKTLAKEVAVTDGWSLTAEDNAATVSAPASLAGGATGTLTYGLEGFSGLALAVMLRQPTLSAALPGGATEAQAAEVRKAAQVFGLDTVASVDVRTGGVPTLDALECFSGVLRADSETANTLIVGYDFGISGLRPVTVEVGGVPTACYAVEAKVQGDRAATLPADYVDGTMVALTLNGTPVTPVRTDSAPGVRTLYVPVASLPSEPSVRFEVKAVASVIR